MANYRWSAELQKSDRQSCCSKYRRLITCVLISGIVSAALAVTFVVVWCLYDGDGDAFVAIKGDNYTTADWERIIMESGPLNRGWEKEAEYKLVSSTENVLDLNIAMGAPKQWMWLTKYFDDRLTVQNASSDGLAKINWKLTWKFMDLFERNEVFRLNEAFDGVYGSNLGPATANCTALRPNTLLCEVQHSEIPDWHMSNRIEFFNIGSVVTTHVPYKDDLTAKKYYERLVKAGGVGDQPYKSPDTEEADDFWSMDEWEDDS